VCSSQLNALVDADADHLLLLYFWPARHRPAEVVRGTLQSLISDAPTQLLAQELLLGAGTAPGWWSHKQHFTLTAATSSMLGYLIGLGDRHLDNLLLERGSGEVVHIDYSVVWDKGQQLRVPEVVPFRLTSMMQVRTKEGTGFGLHGQWGCMPGCGQPVCLHVLCCTPRDLAAAAAMGKHHTSFPQCLPGPELVCSYCCHCCRQRWAPLARRVPSVLLVRPCWPASGATAPSWSCCWPPCCRTLP
jgi:hypothetical protein